MQKIDIADIRVRGAVAGFIAAVAMAVANLTDMSLTGQKTNDLRLLGGLLPGGRRIWPVTGTLMHLVNGSVLGSLFALVHHGLPGPVWARGITFALIENLVLWPVIMVTDRIHPDIERGQLDRYNRRGPILAEIARHIVYGAVLGLAHDWLTGRVRRR